jgi:hypothetical protein
MAQFRTGQTSVGDDWHTGMPISSTTPNTVAKLQQLSREAQHRTIQDHSEELELLMGYASGFYVLNYACIMSLLNLCPGF